VNDNDDDYEKSTTTSSGDRSQMPSDEEDDNYHLPLFKRGTVNYRYSGTSSNGDSGFSSSTASFSGLDFSHLDGTRGALLVHELLLLGHVLIGSAALDGGVCS
jgi:hypothetical protein